jgi:hypothetical protein
MKLIKELKIIDLQINSWNGFVFTFIGIDYGNFEGELLGVHFGGTFLIVNFLFFSFDIKSPFK